MITQSLLDVLAILLQGIIIVFPPLPPEVATAVAGMSAQAAALAPTLATLGPLVPFAAIGTVLALFPVMVTLWLTLLAVRVVLWLVNR